jgi:cephalosporin hydroxylase
MSLKSLCDDDKTDKNTWHSYLEKYQELFTPIKSSALLVVEIGINRGGSIKMWDEYFDQATIIGIDLHPPKSGIDLSSKSIVLFLGDAYTTQVSSLIKDADVIIDDGPHTISSQLIFLQLYAHCVKPGGLLIIEDIQNPNDIQVLTNACPPGFTVEINDRRAIKGRYDDILIIYSKDTTYIEP